MAHAVTNDISPKNLSLFVSLKGAGKFFSTPSENGKAKIKFSEIRNKLSGQNLMISIDDKMFTEPVNFVVKRVEPSWRKGFELYVAGLFGDIDDFMSRELNMLCKRLYMEKSGQVDNADDAEAVEQGNKSKKRYVSDDLKAFEAEMDEEGPDVFTYSYTNGFAQVKVHRDLIANLMKVYEFSDPECYQVKLAVDELLMNAYLYGSIEPGRDRTEVHVKMLQGKMLLSVKDMAGVDFDDSPYHTRKKFDPSRMGGLSLVQLYTADWHVFTKSGEFTKITFYKTSAAKGKPK